MALQGIIVAMFRRRKEIQPDYSTMSPELLQHTVDEARKGLVKATSDLEKLELWMERRDRSRKSWPVTGLYGAVSAAAAYAGSGLIINYNASEDLGVHDPTQLVMGIGALGMAAAAAGVVGMNISARIHDHRNPSRGEVPPDTVPPEWIDSEGDL